MYWREGQDVYLIRKDKTIQKGKIVKDEWNEWCVIPPAFIEDKFPPKLPIKDITFHLYKSEEEAMFKLIEENEDILNKWFPTQRDILQVLFDSWKDQQTENLKKEIMKKRIQQEFHIVVD